MKEGGKYIIIAGMGEGRRKTGNERRGRERERGWGVGRLSLT